MPRQVNCASAWGRWLGHLLPGLGLLAAQQAYLHRLCRSYADYRCFSLPPHVWTFLCMLFSFLPAPTVLLPFLSSPLFLPSRCPPPLPPCSMRHQVGSATLGCRAALRASSATACLRVRGPGPTLQMSTKPYITWTGCSMVSLQQTSMMALDAGCDVHNSSFIFMSSFSDCKTRITMFLVITSYSVLTLDSVIHQMLECLLVSQTPQVDWCFLLWDQLLSKLAGRSPTAKKTSSATVSSTSCSMEVK